LPQFIVIDPRGASSVVTAADWLTALGQGLQALGAIEALGRLECEVLSDRAVIARDDGAGLGFVIYRLTPGAADETTGGQSANSVDLVADLSDGDRRRVDERRDELVPHGAQTVPELESLYRSAEDPVSRFYAVQLLGFSGSPTAIRVLLDALGDTAPSVRAEACRSLEDLGIAAACSRLGACMEDPDEAVRRAAREAVRAIGCPSPPRSVDPHG